MVYSIETWVRSCEEPQMDVGELGWGGQPLAVLVFSSFLFLPPR